MVVRIGIIVKVRIKFRIKVRVIVDLEQLESGFDSVLERCLLLVHFN